MREAAFENWRIM
jgi:hypothetical protein